MGLHRRQQWIEPPRGQRCDLLQRARLQHRVEPRIDPRIKLVAIGREKHRAELARRQQRRQSVAMPVGQRTPGRLDHFQRARDAAAVARLQALGGMTGSRRANSACSASTPSRSSRARTASRISGGIGGTADSPRVSALK